MEPGNDREHDLLNQAIHPKYVCKFQRNRSQQYDRRGQYHAVTHNPMAWPETTYGSKVADDFSIL